MSVEWKNEWNEIVLEIGETNLIGSTGPKEPCLLCSLAFLTVKTFSSLSHKVCILCIMKPYPSKHKKSQIQTNSSLNSDRLDMKKVITFSITINQQLFIKYFLYTRCYARCWWWKDKSVYVYVYVLEETEV